MGFSSIPQRITALRVFTSSRCRKFADFNPDVYVGILTFSTDDHLPSMPLVNYICFYVYAYLVFFPETV